MAWFSRKRAQPDVTEALSAKPMQLVEPDVQMTDDGGAKLKVRVRPGRWSVGIFKLPEGATKTYEMDAIGWLVWTLCDGKTSVQQIIRRVAKRYNISVREAEVSTSVFLRTLIRKGLVGVALPEAKE